MLLLPPLYTHALPDNSLWVESRFRSAESPCPERVVLRLPAGSPVLSCAGGEVVSRLERDPLCGRSLRINHGRDAEGHVWSSELHFLSGASVRLCDLLQPGQEIARSGLSPSGEAALGLILRRNGRAVDPLYRIDWGEVDLVAADGGGPLSLLLDGAPSLPQSAADWERALVCAGALLGSHGPAGDGVDGRWSELDQFVLERFQDSRGLPVGRRDRATAEALIQLQDAERQAA